MLKSAYVSLAFHSLLRRVLALQRRLHIVDLAVTVDSDAKLATASRHTEELPAKAGVHDARKGHRERLGMVDNRHGQPTGR